MPFPVPVPACTARWWPSRIARWTASVIARWPSRASPPPGSAPTTRSSSAPASMPFIFAATCDSDGDGPLLSLGPLGLGALGRRSMGGMHRLRRLVRLRPDRVPRREHDDRSDDRADHTAHAEVDAVAGGEADDEPADERSDPAGGERLRVRAAAVAEDDLREPSHQESKSQDEQDQHGTPPPIDELPIVVAAPRRCRPGRRWSGRVTVMAMLL